MQGEVTQLLVQAREGDHAAFDRLYELVYGELRRLARAQLRRGRPGDTLQTTALVHEAYLKLCDASTLDIADRSHFFALSARVMRHILVNHFRRKNTGKRGGGRRALSLDSTDIPAESRPEIILAVDEAVGRLSKLDDRLATVVEYKFFGGMTEVEIGHALGVSDRTVRREWHRAKAWLTRELAGYGV